MAQMFPQEGLNYIFKQLSMGGSSATAVGSTYYVGLFKGGTGSTVPTNAAVLSTTTFTGSFAEVTGSGYARQSVTFNTIADSYGPASPAFSGAISAGGTVGSWVITVSSTTNVRAGMTATFGASAETKVITNVLSSTQLVLSAALVNAQTTVTVSDLYPGRKVYPSSNVVFGPATGTWDAATGYFVATTANNTGSFIYFANFADATSPMLGANDTLTVTPTLLLSN